MLHTVAILGDSRAFDTYYTNSRYAARYGYDKTFSHIWRRSVLTDPSGEYDVVHVPDHFRGGTVKNNIIRLALTDPSIIVILDGIWETLLNKGHFVEYVERCLRGHKTDGETALELRYSSRRMIELFKAGQLSVSPQRHAERIRTLVSYFRRRQRQVIWLTLPVPPKYYVGSTYHAGDYRPIPDWEACLAAVNDAAVPVVREYGGTVVDLTALMDQLGGPEKAFIDQWHFSEVFHKLLATKLDQEARVLLRETPGPAHVSHEFMLGGHSDNLPPEVVVHRGDSHQELELELLAKIGPEQILIYPTELGDIDNPRGNDRAEFEKQAL